MHVRVFCLKVSIELIDELAVSGHIGNEMKACMKMWPDVVFYMNRFISNLTAVFDAVVHTRMCSTHDTLASRAGWETTEEFYDNIMKFGTICGHLLSRGQDNGRVSQNIELQLSVAVNGD